MNVPMSKDEPCPEQPKSFLILNRELSLLDFQSRVLEEAADPANPLLERLKFLSIFASNMDEFFMVRVSGIRKLVEAQISDLSPDGLTAAQQLTLIRKRALALFKLSRHLWISDIYPALKKQEIRILNYKELTKAQKEKADHYFQEIVFPILTPLVLDSAHPFPHISNLSLNFAIEIKDFNGEEKFARLKVPATLPRLLALKNPFHDNETAPVHAQTYVWLDQVIAANLPMLFPGMKIAESHQFRVIRDADLEIQELEADDLLPLMEQFIQRRKFGSVVMVAIHKSMPGRIRKLLVENLEINKTDLYELSGIHGLANLQQVYDEVDRPDLKYPRYDPVIPSVFAQMQSYDEIFAQVRQGDQLLHHPYDSFIPVVEFLKAAARDPDVLAIKQTLYRVGQNSPVVEALVDAAERGKQVAVLVELKARFDEESNISWARRLEDAGAHVVYGLVGLKIHCKIALVARREKNSIQRYLHLSTGNYNAVTARTYEDIGLFTCDEALAADASDLFNYLTGYSRMKEYRKLIVAPLNLRQKFQQLIQNEVEHVRHGKQGYIILKANSLTDPAVIQMLYQASCAGVKIDLIIRGMCCLVPGVENISENIRVFSILGRYLEHSRIFYFKNGGDERLFLGSADLMSRNMDRRVETVFPVSDESQVRYLRDDVLESYLRDNQSARELTSRETYLRLIPVEDEEKINVQQVLMKHRLT